MVEVNNKVKTDSAELRDLNQFSSLHDQVRARTRGKTIITIAIEHSSNKLLENSNVLKLKVAVPSLTGKEEFFDLGITDYNRAKDVCADMNDQLGFETFFHDDCRLVLRCGFCKNTHKIIDNDEVISDYIYHQQKQNKGIFSCIGHKLDYQFEFHKVIYKDTQQEFERYKNDLKKMKFWVTQIFWNIKHEYYNMGGDKFATMAGLYLYMKYESVKNNNVANKLMKESVTEILPERLRKKFETQDFINKVNKKWGFYSTKIGNAEK